MKFRNRILFALLLMTAPVTAEEANVLRESSINGVRIGDSRLVAEKTHGASKGSKGLGPQYYELSWSKGPWVVFDKKSNAAVEILGDEFSLKNRTIVKKGMTSSAVLTKTAALGWPKPTISTPENHAWVRGDLRKQDYCVISFQFPAVKVRINLTKDVVDSVVETVKEN